MTIDNVLEILEKHKLYIPSNVFYELKADIVNFEEPTTKNNLGVDCIDRAELFKAMDIWDKFGYTTRYGLERLNKDDKGFVPYVKYDDMVNCVKGMPSVTPQEPILDKLRAEIDKIYEREGNSVDCLNALNELKWFIDKYKAESEET